MGLMILVAILAIDPVWCQYAPYYTTPQSYSNYYTSNLQQYHRPPVSPAQYTFDRVYYHNPNVSPYLNLVRPGARLGLYGSNNYLTYVKPEMDRRALLNDQQFNAPIYSTGQRTVPSNLAYNQFYNHP